MTSGKNGWPENLVIMHKCRICGGSFTESYFIKWLRDNRGVPAVTTGPICDPCAVRPRRARREGELFSRDLYNPCWMERSACKDATPEERDYFFADSLSKEVDYAANNFCKNCPVLDECLQYAYDTKSFGLWGGKYFRQAANGSQRRPTNVIVRGRPGPRKDS